VAPDEGIYQRTILVGLIFEMILAPHVRKRKCGSGGVPE
jgi:hypothetical protein